MARTRTVAGEVGTLSCHPYLTIDGRDVARPTGSQQRPDLWVAQTRIRGNDELAPLRRVRAEGKTKQAAVLKLRAKVDQMVEDLKHDQRRQEAGPGGSLPTTSIAEHLERWIDDQHRRVAGGDRAVGTVLRYQHAITWNINPALGPLPLSKVDLGQLARFLRTLTPAVGKTCRAVLRAAFDEAVLDGAVATNPCLGLPRIIRPRNTVHRATGMDRAQADQMLTTLYNDPLAVAADIPDVLLLIACTGCRTAEALALAWTDVNLADGTLTIGATVNAKGQRQEHTKTSAGMRTVSIPPRAVTMLHRRAKAHGGHSTLVFPAERMGTGNRRDNDTPRWTSNFTGQVRRLLNKHGYPDITSRSLRKMVATELDRAGLTGRQIADQLGHAKPSITMDIYQIRIGQGPKQAATLLE